MRASRGWMNVFGHFLKTLSFSKRKQYFLEGKLPKSKAVAKFLRVICLKGFKLSEIIIPNCWNPYGI